LTYLQQLIVCVRAIRKISKLTYGLYGVALQIGSKCCTICIYGRIITTDKDGECDALYFETVPESILKVSGQPRNISARITDHQLDLNRENCKRNSGTQSFSLRKVETVGLLCRIE